MLKNLWILLLLKLLFSTVAFAEDNSVSDDSLTNLSPITEDIIGGDKKSGKFDMYDNDFYRRIKDKSLFYNIEDINKMMWIVNSIKSDIVLTEEDILGEEAVDRLRERTKSSISFHLDSIISINDDIWSVWVNGQKLSLVQNEQDISVVKVTRRYAILSWSTGYTKFVNSIRNYIDQQKDNSRIKATVKDGIATVVFTLEPNQSFAVADGVFIIEGVD